MRRVRFTSGPIGLVTSDDPYRFVAETVTVGDVGLMLLPNEPLPFSIPEGWRLVKVGPLYAPVHPEMIEEL